MKVVLQRVKSASVTVEKEIIGQIGRGYLVLLGVGKEDTHKTVDDMIAKIKKLRLFPDQDGKTNLSIADVDGEILVVSQFTLYADTRKGTRPSFTESAPPDLANTLYEYFLQAAQPHFKKVAAGQFAADMDVALVNDGPFTVVL